VFAATMALEMVAGRARDNDIICIYYIIYLYVLYIHYKMYNIMYATTRPSLYRCSFWGYFSQNILRTCTYYNYMCIPPRYTTMRMGRRRCGHNPWHNLTGEEGTVFLFTCLIIIFFFLTDKRIMTYTTIRLFVCTT